MRKEIGALLKKFWLELFIGALFVLFGIWIIHEYDMALFWAIFIELFCLFLGILFTWNIRHLYQFQRIHEMAKADAKRLKEASKKGKKAYNYERGILTALHEKQITKFDNLLSQGLNMTITDYERLLIQPAVEASEKSKTGSISFVGTCMILPHNFDKDGDYAKMWNRLYQERFKNLKHDFVRILVDHKKANLLKSIKNTPQKFEHFCDWNSATGFNLYIFAGEYDVLREEMLLALNDFAIINNFAVVGGLVPEKQKMNRALRDQAREIIGCSSLNYRKENYERFLSNLLADDRCKKINLSATDRLNETISYLET